MLTRFYRLFIGLVVCMAGLSVYAADSPGVFVLSPETDMKTFNNWSEAGYELKQIRTDYGADESTDKVEHYFYDAQGRLIRLEIDNENSGEIDSIDYYRYNQDGYIYQVDIDDDNDGDFDAVIKYEVNQDGSIDFQTTDVDNDGEIETTIYFEYDDQTGRLVRKDWYSPDNEGQHDKYELYNYDASGLGFWMATEVCENPRPIPGDDVSSSIITYDYEAGNIISKGVLYTNGGYDSVYVYDDQGRLEKIKSEDTDGNRQVETYIWDLADIPDENTDDGGSSNPSASGCFLGSLRE